MTLAAFNQVRYQPIYLVGFMGSGKTHWGRLLSARLHRNFVDLDQVLERQEDMPVQQIFEKYGEDRFREIEALALRSLIDQHNILVSCGGGTPCFYDNMKFMNETGTTIFLEASPTFLLQNILREPGARPLVKNMSEPEMLFFIEKKLEERNPFYRRATLVWNSAALTEDNLQKMIDHDDA